MLLSDRKITARTGMITPFVNRKVSAGVLSYGLGHFGYDIRVANEWVFIDEDYVDDRVRTTGQMPVLDPKNLDEQLFRTVYADTYDIPAHGFVLAKAVERFRIPQDVSTVCVGKSTYARLGLVVNVTPFEAGWEGCPTLELSNTACLPIRIYANEGIAQVLFYESDEDCESGYKGKYQNQPDRVVLAKVDPKPEPRRWWRK
jgi:dCTP deaminase